MTKKNNYIILILTAITLIVVYACSLQQNPIVPITYYGYPDGFFDGAFSLDSEECMLKATEFYKYYLDLAEGAIILFSEDFSGDGANLKILAEILTNLSLENKHRIVITSLQTDFRGYFKEWLTPVFEEHNAIYGVDYVFLNSVGDVESFSQVCRTDWASAYNGVDHEGSSLDSLPLMASISKASDLDLVVCYA